MADPMMCNSLCSWVNNIVLKSSYPLSKIDFFCNPDPKKDQFITPFGGGGLRLNGSTVYSNVYQTFLDCPSFKNRYLLWYIKAHGVQQSNVLSSQDGSPIGDNNIMSTNVLKIGTCYKLFFLRSIVQIFTQIYMNCFVRPYVELTG